MSCVGGWGFLGLVWGGLNGVLILVVLVLWVASQLRVYVGVCAMRTLCGSESVS